MKRPKLKRNRPKFVNLVELVRNRSRYHPYFYHSSRSYDAPFFSRFTTQSSRQQSFWNNREASTRKRRARFAHSRRRSQSRPELVTVATEDRGVDASPTYSSVHTQYEPYSQPSIPSELRRLLQEESSDSNEEVAKAITRKNNEDPTVPDLNVPQTSLTCSQCNNHVDLVPQVSGTCSQCSNHLDLVIPQTSGTCSQCSNHVDLVIPQTSETCSQCNSHADLVVPDIFIQDEVLEVEEQEHISEPEELQEHSIAENTPNNSRSHVLELAEQPADEEAGGDGHHNNSVIEIEITLTSSNDNNSEDEENAIIDGESEE